MNNTLQGLLGKCCMCYIDDIVVYSDTVEEHLQHLKAVFDALDK